MFGKNLYLMVFFEVFLKDKMIGGFICGEGEMIEVVEDVVFV